MRNRIRVSQSKGIKSGCGALQAFFLGIMTALTPSVLVAFWMLSHSHSIGEYVRGDIHTNTIEGYFSILKRGIMGTYHHVSPKHLKRYLAEFDFRYNERAALGVDDISRADKLVRGIVGKRLTYRDSSVQGTAAS